jgi:hypothetical protein
MAKYIGPMLTGIAQGFQNYQNFKEEQDFVRQSRMNKLVGEQLGNQYQQMANQQRQRQLDEADQIAGYARQAATPNNGALSDAAQSRSTPNWKVKGDFSVDQYRLWDQKYNLPPGTSYALFQTESGGNANAPMSSKGAVGPGQVLPSTAANPGFGLSPSNPKDPDFALSYLSTLYKKVGNDLPKAFAAYNSGIKGDANNPETRQYVPKALNFQKDYIEHTQASEAVTNTTPADRINAARNSGIEVGVNDVNQAVSAQQQQIAMYEKMAQAAARDGKMALATKFAVTADDLRGKQLVLQKDALAVTKEANNNVANLAGGVRSQDDYNNLQLQISRNPAMQAAVRGLNLTGNIDLDRNKLQTLAQRTISLKDQAQLRMQQQELAIKAAAEQRQQQKENAPKQYQNEIRLQDQQRQSALMAKGIPFAPSLAATAPEGTSLEMLQRAQDRVATQNVTFDKQQEMARSGAKNLMNLAKQAYNMLTREGLETGGPVNVIASNKFFPFGNAFFSAQAQQFNKLTADMVAQMQAFNGANGAARSASTAAMYENYKKAKPEISLDTSANIPISHYFYVASAAQNEMYNFLDQYAINNPDASKQSGMLAWRVYEQALGPAMIIDPDTGKTVPNMSGIPTLEDGTPNPNYKPWTVFFANGGHF